MVAGEAAPVPVFRGFLVHAYADNRKNRLYFLGRLEDGRSFAVVESDLHPSFHVYEKDIERCAPLLSSIKYEVKPARLESFAGKEALSLLEFSRTGDRTAAFNNLARGGISGPDGDMKIPDTFLADRRIRLWMEIRGPSRPGRLVDLVFPEPELVPVSEIERAGTVPPLRIASIDIETDTEKGTIRAIGISWAEARSFTGDTSAFSGLVRVLGTGEAPSPAPPNQVLSPVPLIFHPDEPSLLRAFIDDIRTGDPDVLTGWNFLDFDFKHIAERCALLGIPFAIGRSGEDAKFFSGEAGDGGRWGGRRSAAALVPGRQVIDALRVVRAGGRGLVAQGEGGQFSDFSLESVSRAVLGEGKLVAFEKTYTGNNAGEEKIARLNQLYAEAPRTFGEYCYRDAELVQRILAVTGLFALTVERASLTGVSLDKAWTSVVSFERIYGMELRKRGIAPPGEDNTRSVSGAAGGTVLDPLPGFYRNVAVFDFRSLYPSIMHTFNIDPLAHARAALSLTENAPIKAPNGAAFSRTPGILPELITGYFAARRKALDAGDETASQVYKILMNSFYGVLGTRACRYGRTELAGAITSFARKWLLFSRDWFTGKGFKVLYGDTDSLFVETALEDTAGYDDFRIFCGDLAAELNRFLAEKIRAEYDLESYIELRFEKLYRRLLLPSLRSAAGGMDALEDDNGNRAALRGRAKGYGGFLIDPKGGGETVEVKGMEAVRSDATPLARRLQLELLELIFRDGTEEEFREKVRKCLQELREGKLDGELIYRKRLSRPPESYTASTPPQVKAARALGWKGRRGAVEFVWTNIGAEPVSLPHAPLDYEHYANSQVLPVAKSIADALHWDMDSFFRKGKNRSSKSSGAGQMELDFDK
ncbi:DNA polymerase [Spirochaetia bacterium]|nr:DNA polymerase [Spirochaetia bacterium]